MKKITLVLVICTLSAMFAFALSGCGESKLDKEVSFHGKFSFSMPRDWQQKEKDPNEYYSSDGKSHIFIRTSNASSPEEQFSSMDSGAYSTNNSYQQTKTGTSSSGIKYQIYFYSFDVIHSGEQVEKNLIFFFIDSKLYYIGIDGDGVSAKDIANTLK